MWMFFLRIVLVLNLLELTWVFSVLCYFRSELFTSGLKRTVWIKVTQLHYGLTPKMLAVLLLLEAYLWRFGMSSPYLYPNVFRFGSNICNPDWKMRFDGLMDVSIHHFNALVTWLLLITTKHFCICLSKFMHTIPVFSAKFYSQFTCTQVCRRRWKDPSCLQRVTSWTSDNQPTSLAVIPKDHSKLSLVEWIDLPVILNQDIHGENMPQLERKGSRHEIKLPTFLLWGDSANYDGTTHTSHKTELWFFFFFFLPSNLGSGLTKST